MPGHIARCRRDHAGQAFNIYYALLVHATTPAVLRAWRAAGRL